MYKRILFFLSFFISSVLFAQQEADLFGYNKDLMATEYKQVKNILRAQKIKKIAFYGATGALLVGVFSLKLMKHMGETNVLTYEQMMASMEKINANERSIGWGHWLWNGAKWITGESVIRGTSGYIVGLYGGYAYKSLPMPSLGWYIKNKASDVLSLLKELEEGADLLPLEEDYEERFYKATIYEEKIRMMIPNAAGVIAYMIYVKRQVEKESITDAVRMDYIIQHLKKSLYTFCSKTEKLLHQYKEDKDTQEAMKLAVDISTTFSVFIQHFYSDIKAFERYEVLEDE
jgi:hypothetical protein